MLAWVSGGIIIPFMRITGGQARGIPLTIGKARQVRPATDRMREAVFSSLGPRVHGASFLDLFAGSGSYGLEALSRGAGEGLFVEKNPLALQALQDNVKAVLKSLGYPEGLEPKTIRRDVLRFTSNRRFDIIFMDPPYELARSHSGALLELVAGLLAADGVLVYELPGDLDPSASGWTCFKRIGKSGTNEPSPALMALSPGGRA